MNGAETGEHLGALEGIGRTSQGRWPHKRFQQAGDRVEGVLKAGMQASSLAWLVLLPLAERMPALPGLGSCRGYSRGPFRKPFPASELLPESSAVLLCAPLN